MSLGSIAWPLFRLVEPEIPGSNPGRGAINITYCNLPFAVSFYNTTLHMMRAHACVIMIINVHACVIMNARANMIMSMR